MEIETTGTEGTTEQATPGTDLPVADAVTSSETTDEGTSEPGSQPAWKPSFKYKVYDKEKEIPETFRGFITDADKEKAFRELFEKADGLDQQKPIHQQVVKERNELAQHYQQVTQQHQQAVEGIKKIHNLSKTDLDTFFDVYKLPKEQIFNWVAEKLRMDELAQQDPSMARRLQGDQEARRQSYAYQDRLQQLERQNKDMMLSQHQNQFQQTMSHPEVQSFARQFDERYGRDSFQRQVNDFGDLHYRRNNGQYLSPWQCAQAVISQYKTGFQPPQAATPPSQGTSATEAGAAPATIPNIGSGRSVSPTKPRFKSLDQLREYAAKVTQER